MNYVLFGEKETGKTVVAASIALGIFAYYTNEECSTIIEITKVLDSGKNVLIETNLNKVDVDIAVSNSKCNDTIIMEFNRIIKQIP